MKELPEYSAQESPTVKILIGAVEAARSVDPSAYIAVAVASVGIVAAVWSCMTATSATTARVTASAAITEKKHESITTTSMITIMMAYHFWGCLRVVYEPSLVVSDGVTND